ncbi:MAG: hypothetical protein ACKOWF_15800 [Chloroflexota bacterium]
MRGLAHRRRGADPGLRVREARTRDRNREVQPTDLERFDRAARLLAGVLSRRRHLAGLLGIAAAAPIVPGVAAGGRRRRPDQTGPCGKLGRNNACQRDSDCCTGHCKKLNGKLKRCRCLKRGETCHQGQTCCGKLMCMDKVCTSPDVPETCLVCASGCSFSTVDAAVAAAADGAVIPIAPGTYPTPAIIVDRTVTLKACNGEPGVVLTQPDGNSYMFEDADGGNPARVISLVGLTLRGAGPASNVGIIYSQGGATWQVTGCTFTNASLGWEGNLGSGSFTNCTFTGNDQGIYSLIDVADGDITIDGCSFSQNTIGVYLQVDNGTGTNVFNILNSTFTANEEQAIQLSGPVSTISGCTITGNGTSQTSPQPAISLYEATVTISGTSITDNTSGEPGGGIYLASGSLVLGAGVTVTRNTASDGSGLAVNSAATITGASSSVIFGNLVGANCERQIGVGPWNEVPNCIFP